MRHATRKAMAVTLAAGALTVISLAVSAQPSAAFKLDGAWVARAQEAPLVWTYVVSMDPSGRRAALHGSVEVGLGGGATFGADDGSPLLGEVVMTGPTTARFNTIWYGPKRLPPGSPVTAQIVYIGVNSGTIEFIAPGKMEGTHHIKYFLPSQDADGDGFPDPGQVPVAEAPEFHTIDTRVPAPTAP